MTEDDKKEQSKILRFSAETSSPTHDSSLKKYQATAKYDRKALTQRLSLEEWMHYELRRLYGCKDDEDYKIEVDIDILLQQENDEKRKEMLQKLLHAAKEPTNDFITELLKRMQDLEPHVVGKPTTPWEASL